MSRFVLHERMKGFLCLFPTHSVSVCLSSFTWIAVVSHKNTHSFLFLSVLSPFCSVHSLSFSLSLSPSHFVFVNIFLECILGCNLQSVQITPFSHGVLLGKHVVARHTVTLPRICSWVLKTLLMQSSSGSLGYADIHTHTLIHTYTHHPQGPHDVTAVCVQHRSVKHTHTIHPYTYMDAHAHTH